jgi:hypothetical protein
MSHDVNDAHGKAPQDSCLLEINAKLVVVIKKDCFVASQHWFGKSWILIAPAIIVLVIDFSPPDVVSVRQCSLVDCSAWPQCDSHAPTAEMERSNSSRRV